MNQEEFIQFFKLDTHLGELIKWVDNSAVGFSLVKEYPAESKFIPVKNPNGTNDSVALIKIGYLTTNGVDNTAKLLMSISKASKYLFKHHFYNFEDPNCPTRDSVIASEKSKQPADLHENRYVLDLKNKKIIDTENHKKEISGNELIINIWKLHLKSITYLPFRGKLRIRQIGLTLANIITPNKYPDNIATALKRFLNSIGWELKTDDNNEFLLGLTKTYSFKAHMRRKESEKIVVLGLPLNKTPTLMSMFLISALLVVNFYFDQDVLQIVNFITNQINGNIIFQTAFAATVVYFVDFLMPRITLFLINFSIRLRTWLWRPIKIS